jgi:hypothetical protein
MADFDDGDLTNSVRDACHSVVRALGLEYVVSNECGPIAVFRPIEGVKVSVSSAIDNYDAVDVCFERGEVFGDYASAIRRMGEVDGCLLCCGSNRGSGLVVFDRDYDDNIASKDGVDIGMHVNSAALPFALLYMFREMTRKGADALSDELRSLGAISGDSR